MTSLLSRVVLTRPDVVPGNTATDAAPPSHRFRMPEPRPAYPHLEPPYFETARMAREMKHL